MPPLRKEPGIEFAVILAMQRARDLEVIFPIKDAASAALMLMKADCLYTAGIINAAERQYVHFRARTFLDDATLKDAVLKSRTAYHFSLAEEHPRA